MNYHSVKTQITKRTQMCDAASWSGSGKGDNYGAIRTQSFNPESKEKK